jgi:hypothetical protein
MSGFEIEPLSPLFDSRRAANTDWSFPAPRRRRKKTGLTTAQLLAILEARNQEKDGSFVDTLKSAGSVAASPALWAFDKIARPGHGVMEGLSRVNEAARSGEPDDDWKDLKRLGSGFLAGLKGETHKNYGDVLKDEGFLKGHGTVRGLAGFGGDVVFDPLNFLSLGAAGAGKGAATAAAKAVSKSGLYGRAGADELSELDNAVRVLENAGPTYQHRLALGKVRRDIAGGTGEYGHAEVSMASQAAAAAKAEARLHDPRQLKVGVQVPFTRGRDLSLNTGIRLPKGKLGNSGIPLLAPAAATLGKAFKGGYEDPILHAQLLARRHQGERMAAENFNMVRENFGRLESLSEKEQLDALHFFEKTDEALPSVIKTEEGYVLNPARIEAAKAAGLTDDQLAFVHAMHKTGETFAAKHREYGLQFEHLGEKGQMYVPHILRKGVKELSDDQRNLLTKRGFVKGRSQELSLKELAALHDAGKLGRKIETNPYKILTMHARSVANQHADTNLTNYMRDALGVPKRVVDERALAAVRGALPDAQKAIDDFQPADLKGLEKAKSVAVARAKTEAAQRLSKTLARNTALIRHHLESGPHTRTTMATVARISKRNLEAQKRYQDDLAAIERGELPALKRELKKIDSVVETKAKELRKLHRKLKGLQNLEKKVGKGTKNPKVDPATMTTVPGMKDANGHPYVFPKETADAITRLHKVIEGDEEILNLFANSYRKWIGKWKLGVTSINPGYGVRNTLSDAWNMYLAGIPMSEMVLQGGRAARLMAKAKKGDPNALRRITEAYDQGVLSGLFAGDIQQVTNMIEHGGSKKALAKKGRLIKLGGKVMQDMNRNRENWGRLTHYMYRRDVQGMSAADAALEVKKAHFDYEDLTEFEQKWMKVAAPFYTWSRKNIPFQIQQLASRPGKMAAFPKFAEEMDAAAGGSEGESVPDYMRKGMYLKMPIGGGKYVAPMIGVTDLARASSPVDGAKSLLTPAVKLPLELALNRNMLTGADIKSPTGYSRNPVNDSLGDFLRLIPGSNVGTTARNTPEGLTQGMGADPRLLHILGALPITNTAFNQTGKIRKAQREGDGNKALVSWLTGVNATPVNQEQQREFAELEFREHMQQLMKDLRAEGLLPPVKKRKKSRNQQSVDSALLQALRG